MDYSELLEFLTVYPTAKFSVPTHATELHCHQPCWLTPATFSAVTVRGGGIGQKLFLKKDGGVVDLGTARNSEIPSEVNKSISNVRNGRSLGQRLTRVWRMGPVEQVQPD